MYSLAVSLFELTSHNVLTFLFGNEDDDDPP